MRNNFYDSRILVVEDQHLMRELTIEALNSVGFAAVEGAENGAKALGLMKQMQFDVIISDIEMEPIDGFELGRTIRAGETSHPRNLPIIYLTGFSDVATLSSATALDVNLFIVKPASARLLYEKISQALSGEVRVQPAAAYRITEARRPGAVAPAPVEARQDSGAPRRKVDILMLSEGMILEQDVRAGGKLLLKAGTRLLEVHISVLLDMRTMLDDRVLDVTLPSS